MITARSKVGLWVTDYELGSGARDRPARADRRRSNSMATIKPLPSFKYQNSLFTRGLATSIYRPRPQHNTNKLIRIMNPNK